MWCLILILLFFEESDENVDVTQERRQSIGHKHQPNESEVMVELIVWGDGNLRERQTEMHSIAESGMAADKSAVIEGLQTQYRQLVASLIG